MHSVLPKQHFCAPMTNYILPIKLSDLHLICLCLFLQSDPAICNALAGDKKETLGEKKKKKRFGITFG